MKIIHSIESIYEERVDIIMHLKKDVDGTFINIKSDAWHYLSRIKGKESFALKLETGRCSDVSQLEDFFACTLVVENLDQIKKAQEIIRDHFAIIEQRPKSASFTHKNSYSFEFDDLRIYAKIKTVEYLPPSPISEILFEIQIKTFLQHAWSIATHDLIYKTEEINWPKERIAFQVKAMLEQAELVISGVDGLIKLPEVLKNNKESLNLIKILEFYNNNFEKDDLPADAIRLCKNTSEFLSAIGLKINELVIIMTQEKAVGRGTNLKNLSPFLLIVQSVIYRRKDLIETFLNDDKATFRYKLIFPKELNTESLNINYRNRIVEVTSANS